jgi:MoaA/NifB/PqqE/SkfB family radical SAM enzyme
MYSKKDFLLNESKTFCMYPWVHMHASPEGISYPCCTANPSIPIGNTRQSSIGELINSPKMRSLRLSMLNEVKSPMCTPCYNLENAGIKSARIATNDEFKQFFDEVASFTNLDGSISEFKMRYFDVRFNNLCNFKCRTCGSGFSTQWEAEDLRNGVPYARVIPKNDHQSLVDEVLGHIDHIHLAYFAGGEPLINEQHYIILEEFLRRGRTDVRLRYNTNVSNLKYKDKDILGLWSKFDTKIELYASIDHYGPRAEYIRHGTDWNMVEQNLTLLHKQPSIHMSLNTVMSFFNYLTLKDFYSYLDDMGWYSEKLTTYPMHSPEHLTSMALPEIKKQEGHKNLNELLNILQSKGYTNNNHYQQLLLLPNWVNEKNYWEPYKHFFKSEVERIDKIRGEDFCLVFPELADVMEM